MDDPRLPEPALAPPSNVYVAPPPDVAPRRPRAAGDELAAAIPLDERGVPAVLDALLKAPGRVVGALQEGPGVEPTLAAIAAAALVVTGLVMATFSGGLQLLVVPLKLALGMALAAAICLPSLHVFSCLSGAEQSLRQTAGALLMGVALMGVLLVGFAPVLWLFGQATHSAALMGSLHLFFFLVSAGFGLGLSHRALRAMNARPVAGSALWSVMFVGVMLQMSTVLRPLVGPWDGMLVHERMSFLEHWARVLAGG
jgi:hypothetical protein